MQTEIDELGYVNGVDPTDWVSAIKLGIHMTEAERRLAYERWFNPRLIAIRQGCMPMMDDGKLPYMQPQLVSHDDVKLEDRL